jgi:hypothetical protein
VGQDERRRVAVRARPDRYAQVAGRWVRWAWGTAPARASVASHRLIRNVQSELLARRRRRRIVRWTAAAALPITLVVGLISAITVRGGGASHPLTETSRDPDALMMLEGEVEGARLRSGMPVAVGARLVAAEDHRIRIGTSDGTRLTLAPRSVLSVVENQATKRFALLRGAIHVHVRKLAPGERFIVETSDAEIEVRGTTFEVVLATNPPPCGTTTLTRVLVWEGVVAVRRPSGVDEVRTAEEWPPRCPTTTAPPGSPVERRLPRQPSFSRAAH